MRDPRLAGGEPAAVTCDPPRAMRDPRLAGGEPAAATCDPPRAMRDPRLAGGEPAAATCDVQSAMWTPIPRCEKRFRIQGNGFASLEVLDRFADRFAGLKSLCRAPSAGFHAILDEFRPSRDQDLSRIGLRSVRWLRTT